MGERSADCCEKKVDSEDGHRDVRSCQPTPGEEGGANLDPSSSSAVAVTQ